MSTDDKPPFKITRANEWIIIEWLESGAIEVFRLANWHSARTILECTDRQLALALSTVDPKLWIHRQPPTKEQQ